MSELPVPDADTEKEFLTNALVVWLKAHDRSVPSIDDLSNQIFYYPAGQESDLLTLEDENVSEDGA